MVTGSIVALVTPMLEDGSIDWDCLDALVDWHIEAGTDGIVAVGTTGESATLTHQEHVDVVARVVARADGRVPVIAGTGSNNTAEAIDYSVEAERVGADACLLVTPYYNRPTQEGLFRHYAAVAERLSIPQILYNVPGRCGCDLLPETVARLADVDGIVGIKEATGDVQRGCRILELCGERMAVYSGEDITAVELMLNGACGTISVTANVAPARSHEVAMLALAGQAEAARAADRQLVGLHQALFVEGNPIPVKWALARMGRISSGIRLPLTELSAPFHDQVLAAMQQAGAID